MRFIANSGNDRVVDYLSTALPGTALDAMTPEFSLFAFGELRKTLAGAKNCRLLLNEPTDPFAALLGSDYDRANRNRLTSAWLARRCSEWLSGNAESRFSPKQLSQSALIIRNPDSPERGQALFGACHLTTSGLGLTPGETLDWIYASENERELTDTSARFEESWRDLPPGVPAGNRLASALAALGRDNPPSLIYFRMLWRIFSAVGDELDEEKIVKSATGIKSSVVWNKLYRFQRDGVIGAIDKLERHGGCIIADSVGLGKTFEALAVIKYYELRNCRALVLCPRRLRDNWILYRANDRRNSLEADRFAYDVLNHTDLSRDEGFSGDLDLANVNWGNYDLVVIDESHNFRNRPGRKDHDSRYERLMNRIVRSGVKSKVLMLSATPVNSRLNDLRNQLAFAAEGDDKALAAYGVDSIEATVRLAQSRFNKWVKRPEADRNPEALLDLLGFDYFRLLDLVTIARSRRHIERYYGLSETGTFPERPAPINIKSNVDRENAFPSIAEINNDIQRLNLAAYGLMRYVREDRLADYAKRYDTSVKSGNVFKQVDREKSLVGLIRVNLLKRMESSVHSFALTLRRQLDDITRFAEKLDRHEASACVEELSIEDIDIDDPAFEPLLAGDKVKVLLRDLDSLRWRQELAEDAGSLASLLRAAERVDAARDAKLADLRQTIFDKCRRPINPGNRKIIVFSAFADTVDYLYGELAPWALAELGLHSALVRGTGGNRTNLPRLRPDLGSVLSAFSPRSKERPPEFAGEGEIDLLFATDCISEGQNLQDCDCLVNYDIHWNPVRIIQRFGRIDRLGSVNRRIQLINFWPNMELEQYIDLERRVTGRMALLDISATGEENVIEQRPGDGMNDLEYRRRQLLKLQHAVIDLEDLSSGVSITDMNLSEYRIELASYLREHPGRLEGLPPGLFAVTAAPSSGAELKPGVIFCLRSASEKASDNSYPLHPYYLVQVDASGNAVLPFIRAKQIMDVMKGLCLGRDGVDGPALASFNRQSKNGGDMTEVRKLLAAAIQSINGVGEERALASLFSPGGTHAFKGEFQGIGDFEVEAFLVVVDP
jgi:hypothetical protein